MYVPSTNEAWTSLQYLNHQQFWGWYLRAVHQWGSTFMVAMMTLHMIQVFLFGAYKYPRELTWVTGVFLFVMTLGMAFTGQVMRFDQDAYWGLAIGASITGRVPVFGAQLVHLLLAGPIIAGETLSRFFTLHVFIIPGLLIAIISMHLRLVLTKGINEYPKPGVPVHRATYDAEYAEILRKEGVPFVPNAVGKDLIFSAAMIVAILVVSFVFGPKGPGGPPNPTLVNTAPRPDFYFLSIFAALALLPDWMEVLVLFVAPAIIGRMVVRFALLLRDRRKELQAPAGSCADRVVFDSRHRHPGLHGGDLAVVSEDGCLERRRHPGPICPKPQPAGSTRRTRSPEQAVPELSFAWRRGWTAGTGARRCRHAPDA